MIARLVSLAVSPGPAIPIQQPVLLVGRHPEADIRLDSPLISRRHCCLAVVYDRFLIRDLGSRHGVFVNGVRVDEAELRPGNEVAIAHLIYRFEIETPPAAVARPTRIKAPPVEITDEDLVPFDD